MMRPLMTEHEKSALAALDGLIEVFLTLHGESIHQRLSVDQVQNRINHLVATNTAHLFSGDFAGPAGGQGLSEDFRQAVVHSFSFFILKQYFAGPEEHTEFVQAVQSRQFYDQQQPDSDSHVFYARNHDTSDARLFFRRVQQVLEVFPSCRSKSFSLTMIDPFKAGAVHIGTSTRREE